MQTPKAKPSSLDVPQKKSPATPRTARELKTPGSDPDHVSSQGRTPKDKSPKVIERRSPRSPATEKKRPSRVSELESQLSKLQEELKKTKDQLNTSESWKRQAQQEAEDAKKQLLTMSEKLEESEQQLTELSASEDDRVHELRQISHDRDKAWQSELEAVQKQHSFDSAAYASAINEIHRLKHQLDMVSQAEATQTKHAESAYAELQSLRLELTETLSLVEKMKTELSDCRESEAEAIELVSRTAKQLETANATTEMLRSDGIKAVEAVNSLSQELEQSKTQVKSLEELISKLQAEKNTVVTNPFQEHRDDDNSKELQLEVNRLKVEVGQLKAALVASEARYQEEYIQSTLQIRSAYEQAEHSKLESSKREAELGSELEKAKASVEELRASLMDKETEFLSKSEENEQLNLKINNNHQCETDSELVDELRKLQHYMAELKTSLLDKESQLQSVREQNEYLKMEIEKVEMERSKVTALTEAARSSEREALMKLGYITEEADKSSRRAGRTADQLDEAQAANTEMEAELRRLKVQADQWRKAAEAATAILSTGKNGKFVERTGSLDSNMDSSVYSEDMDDDSPKKKNGNMLKKMGVLWKKGQK